MLEVTVNHIRFWDAHKLRLAHAALVGSEARQRLAALYLATPKVKRMVTVKTAPALPEAPSVHKLIPECERDSSIFHRRAPGRKKARNARGKDYHLMGNLSRFVAGKVRRGESFTEALLSFCDKDTGRQPYAKFARRWARKLKILAA
jgi:hypothetical protein